MSEVYNLMYPTAFDSCTAPPCAASVCSVVSWSFPLAADARKQELIEKYKQLKKSGKLEKFLETRRKKNAAKDHRYIPTNRRSAADE
eukprot:1191392-Prorocentrum_minimum.AAC.1